MKDIMHNWKGILLLTVILSAGCVRIDMPEIVFEKPKTYATKKECRVFHEKEGFFPFCRDGGWWIEGVDYFNQMLKSSDPEVDIKPQTILPVGTLLQENRSEMQYGFSLWYLLTLFGREGDMAELADTRDERKADHLVLFLYHGVEDFQCI